MNNEVTQVPSISLNLVTKFVSSETIPTRFSIVYGRPVFGMSKSAMNWYISRIKNENLVKRMKNRSL